MSNPLNQLDLFGLAVSPPPPQPTISGLHWYDPDGNPLIVTITRNGNTRPYPAQYAFDGLVWSGRGRMPPAIERYNQEKHKGKRQATCAAIEAQMLKRGYRRAEA